MITAKILLDSISPSGQRITTFELEYPRYVHAELMTHRVFSRNAASSRAIPVSKVIQNVMENSVQPHWTMNQPGMQGIDAHEADVKDYDAIWKAAMTSSIQYAMMLQEAGVHKQNVNRLLEPFQHIKVVVTATDFANFYVLRCHKDAQPEIQALARQMEAAQAESKPIELMNGEWHLPYVTRAQHEGNLLYIHDEEVLDLATAKKISASCCAQVSYRLLDDSVEKAERIYDQLVSNTPVHASPFEHQARPYELTENPNHQRNFHGWVQHRVEIAGETVYE